MVKSWLAMTKVSLNLRSASSFSTTFRRSFPFNNSFDTSVLEEDSEDIPEVSVTNISASAYEHTKTPKTIQNPKSKNTILPPVASPSPSMSDLTSPLSYSSPSPSPTKDLSEDLWIKDPFKSRFHAVRMDESCDCSQCDAALDEDYTCSSITMYSAASDEVSLVEDDSSLIPILEPCIAFDFSPYVDYTASPTPPHTLFPIPGAFPILDAGVEDDSGSSWVPSAVVLGIAVVSIAVAWAFWAPYMVWPSRGVGCRLKRKLESLTDHYRPTHRLQKTPSVSMMMIESTDVKLQSSASEGGICFSFIIVKAAVLAKVATLAEDSAPPS
ncbi:hypothetical protein BKA65DRAFT_555670 [Rhexocercosporidium sp. MPI-PUGE-AT-0058]|nr:hypothetical protein BKA65DRAFT_555670 [Rhexocercosporidium sp. MPI-PUGE-AT-0058]